MRKRTIYERHVTCPECLGEGGEYIDYGDRVVGYRTYECCDGSGTIPVSDLELVITQDAIEALRSILFTKGGSELSRVEIMRRFREKLPAESMMLADWNEFEE